jgi:hypothetical protein
MAQDPIVEDITKLIDAGKHALASGDGGDPTEFQRRLEGYLEVFDRWQSVLKTDTSVEQAIHALRDQVRPFLETLSQVHESVLLMCAKNRDAIGVQLSDVHKRASCLKRYIDTQPSRITIAGKRQG